MGDQVDLQTQSRAGMSLTLPRLFIILIFATIAAGSLITPDRPQGSQ